MRQVTHALLTRPPLSSEKFQSIASYFSSHIRTPFDLHVLSTPPAFILSQDQTLKLSLILFRTTLALFFLLKESSKGLFRCPFGLYCFWGTISRLLRMKISNEFSGLSYCLIIKVHVLSFYRSSLTSVPQYFLFVKRFFELFLNSIFSNICVFVDSFHSITPKCFTVNTFFQLFSFLKIVFKKERRKRDLNPRAAINDLLPFQGSPFSRLGISPDADYSIYI